MILNNQMTARRQYPDFLCPRVTSGLETIGIEKL
jgi:hypothetical protein